MLKYLTLHFMYVWYQCGRMECIFFVGTILDINIQLHSDVYIEGFTYVSNEICCVRMLA
jgi:hypothetical protein